MADILERYQGLWAEHGPDLKSLAWSGIEAQLKRFNVLLECYVDHGTVLDVGCGFGDLSLNFSADEYTGIDIVPEFVDEARRKYPTKTFLVEDVDSISGKYDYIFASGLLSFQDNPLRLIKRMWAHTDKVLAFNWKDGNNFDIDLAIKMNAVESWEIRHDYLPQDTTVYMYRSFRQ